MQRASAAKLSLIEKAEGLLAKEIKSESDQIKQLKELGDIYVAIDEDDYPIAKKWISYEFTRLFYYYNSVLFSLDRNGDKIRAALQIFLGLNITRGNAKTGNHELVEIPSWDTVVDRLNSQWIIDKCGIIKTIMDHYLYVQMQACSRATPEDKEVKAFESLSLARFSPELIDCTRELDSLGYLKHVQDNKQNENPRFISKSQSLLRSLFKQRSNKGTIPFHHSEDREKTRSYDPSDIPIIMSNGNIDGLSFHILEDVEPVLKLLHAHTKLAKLLPKITLKDFESFDEALRLTVESELKKEAKALFGHVHFLQKKEEDLFLLGNSSSRDNKKERDSWVSECFSLIEKLEGFPRLLIIDKPQSLVAASTTIPCESEDSTQSHVPAKSGFLNRWLNWIKANPTKTERIALGIVVFLAGVVVLGLFFTGYGGVIALSVAIVAMATGALGSLYALLRSERGSEGSRVPSVGEARLVPSVSSTGHLLSLAHSLPPSPSPHVYQDNLICKDDKIPPPPTGSPKEQVDIQREADITTTPPPSGP